MNIKNWFLFKDKWRSLGSTYLTHIFSLIMCYLSANNCNEVDAFKIKQHVPNVPEFIIDHILKYYTTPCERGK